MSGVFNWNTNVIFLSIVCEYDSDKSTKNQVVVWDQRIKREMTQFYDFHLKNEWIEYYLTDMTNQLEGKEVDVYLRWE